MSSSRLSLALLGLALLSSGVACDDGASPIADTSVATDTGGDTSVATDTGADTAVAKDVAAADTGADIAAADTGVDVAAADTGVDVAIPFTCEGTPTVTNVTPAELNEMLKTKDFRLINVHVPYAGQIPQTDVHVTYTDTAGLEADLGGDKTAKAVLYCLTGPMSVVATKALVALGYCRIYDLPDGMAAWKTAGFTIEQ